MRIAFEPPPGVFSDDTPFSQPGAWEDASNVRFWRGRPQTIGGWTSLLDEDTLGGVCRNIFVLDRTTTNTREVVFGTNATLEVLIDGALVDITPSGLATGNVDSSGDTAGYGTGTYGTGDYGDPQSTYYPRTWALTGYGETLIANPRGDTIYEWDGNSANDATAITNAPDNVTFAIVTPERQVLALGCNEESSGDFNPLCIRGSDIEDPTDWTTSSSNNVFEHILEGGGRIVAGAMLGTRVAVWTNKGFWLGQFLGDPGQAYRFDHISGNCGLIGPNAFAIDGQTARWMAPDRQLWTYTIGGQPTVIPCPVWQEMADNLDTAQRDKVVACPITKFDETWFFYPDTRDGNENSRYIAYCNAESLAAQRPVWFKGALERTAAIPAASLSYPVMADSSGAAFAHESGTTAAGSALEWSIRSSEQYIDEGGRRMQIQRFVPDFEAQECPINLTVYTRFRPRDDRTTKGPYEITTTAARKDFRASGSLIAVEFSGGDAGGSHVRFGKPLFEAVQLGAR